MTMKMLFLLLVYLALSLLEVNCSANFSSAPIISLTSAIENHADSLKETKNETKLEFQSTFNLKNGQENIKKTVQFQFKKLTKTLELRFERVPFGSDTSRIFNIFKRNKNGLNTSRVSIFYGLRISVALILNHNNINSLDATIFQRSLSLLSLKIGMNNLTTLPMNVFRDLVDLTTIILSENHFTRLPCDLFDNNRKLETVKLTENKVPLRDLPSSLFFECNRLEVVCLRGNGIMQLPKRLFWGSYKMKKIDLSKNHLLYLPGDFLRDTRSLRFLDLSSNFLSFLPHDFFSATKRLHKFNLSNNRITALSSWYFLGLKNLKILNMENNGMQLINKDVFIPLSSLLVARFAHNHLNLSTDLRNHQNESSQVSPFHNCRYLKVLDLSHNDISQIFSDWIVNFTLLNKLDLSYNNFSYLESKDLLFNSSNLRVNLTHNLIKMVNLTQAKQLPKNLDSRRTVLIDLNDNPIDCYCDVYPLFRYISGRKYIVTVDFTKYLNYVQLKADQLKCKAPQKYRGWPVEELHRADELTCSVENRRSAACVSGGACDCRIKPRDAVLHLSCDGRNLTEAPAWINTWNIQSVHVNLSGNALQRIPDMTKGGYQWISYLDLSRNQIDRIEKEDFYESKLYVLDLNHNKLTYIDWDDIRSMWDWIENLKMRNNPWICNDGMLAFRDDLNDLLNKSKWDMTYFPCNKTTTSVIFMKNRRIVVSTSITLFLLAILLALCYTIHWYVRSRMRSLHKMQPVISTNEECSKKLSRE